MKRHDGPVSDATVDAYRASLTETKRAITPGAGVDPNKVMRPSKRVRAAHRDVDTAAGLKKYARYLAALNGPTAPSARRWLASKGCRP